jgi:hypothetical protein
MASWLSPSRGENRSSHCLEFNERKIVVALIVKPMNANTYLLATVVHNSGFFGRVTF